MTLIDADRASSLYRKMGPAIEASGGWAANTAAGVASWAAAPLSSARWPRTSSAGFSAMISGRRA